MIGDDIHQKFKPISNFFVDHTKLALPDPLHEWNDAFGPVNIAGVPSTEEYRITSKVRANTTDPVKVFAICSGQILIQPSADLSKVNVILKPSNSFAPIKIKYFIYRGVTLADWIDGDNLKAVDLGDSNQPLYLRKLWSRVRALYHPAIVNTFPLIDIGYDINKPVDTLIEDYFANVTDECQLPPCIAGEHIGNFNDIIGLDVVLDYGDYQLANQEELFRLDLTYARKTEHIFDINTISSSTAVKIKRYREYIHQFIDAAAFWGSHIDCGQMTLSDNTNNSNVSEIYDKVVNKFQTKSKIYLYIQGEKSRSFNYFNAARQVQLILTTPMSIINDTSDWPIIILEESLSNDFRLKLSLVENIIAVNINDLKRHLAIDGVPSYKTLKYPLLSRPYLQNPPIPLATLSIGYDLKKTSDNKASASFLMVYGNIRQVYPLKDYFNDLWPANISAVFSIDPSNPCSWVIYDKSRLVNLDAVFNVSASMQNKIVFDNGKNASATPQSKRRRLYMAMVKRNSDADYDYKYNVASLTSAKIKNQSKNEEYISNLYKDTEYAIYLGTFIDGADTINSLTLVHKKDFQKRNSYFQLGISEDDFAKLSHPTDADNVFFYLEEDTSFLNPNIRKFKLGLQFEDNTGAMVQSFPSGSDIVYVYTLDGNYFFSKEYSQYQEFYDTFSQSSVHFRPTNAWLGQFGFDWVRIGDSGLPSDTITPNDRRASSTIGTAYIPLTSPPEEEEDDSKIRNGTSPWAVEKKKFHSFLADFPLYPIMQGKFYYASSWLTLYPSFDKDGNNSPFPKLNLSGTAKCITEATLNLIIDSSTVPTQLKLKYEKQYLEVNPIVANDVVILPDVTQAGILYGQIEIKKVAGVYPASIEVRIKSLKETDFYKAIAVLALENGKENLAGELCLYPNGKDFRREIDIVLVDCKTDLTNAGSMSFGLDSATTNIHKNKIVDEILFALNQSLTDIATLTVEPLDLSRSTVPSFYTTYGATANTDDGQDALSPQVLHPDLITLFPAGHFDGKVTFFCINEYCRTGNVRTDGEAYSVLGPPFEMLPFIILYKSGLYRSVTSTNDSPNTSSHEMLHALGLFHSFSNSSRHAFKPFITENIMDYSSSLTSTIFRRSLNLFQSNSIRSHKLIKKEP